MSDLLPRINAFFPPVLSGHLAARLGESANAVKRACPVAILLVVNGCVRQQGVCNEVLTLQLRPAAALPGIPPQNLTSITEMLIILGAKDTPGSLMARGEVTMKSLFGEGELLIINALSQYARIAPASARTLLALVSGVMPALMQQVALGQQPSTSDVAVVLLRAKREVQEALAAKLPEVAAMHDIPMQARPSLTLIEQQLQRNSVVALENDLRFRWYVLLLVLLAIGGLKSGKALLEAISKRSSVSAEVPEGAPSAMEPVNVLLPQVKPAKEEPLPGPY